MWDEKQENVQKINNAMLDVVAWLGFKLTTDYLSACTTKGRKIFELARY